MQNFTSILSSHGFTADRYDFESTIIGFDYDIQFAFSDSKIFDFPRSRIFRQWSNPNAFIRADLKVKTGDIAAGLACFNQRWSSELRYQNPALEIVEVARDDRVASIRVLTISRHNAMTLLFNLI